MADVLAGLQQETNRIMAERQAAKSRIELEIANVVEAALRGEVEVRLRSRLIRELVACFDMLCQQRDGRLEAQ